MALTVGQTAILPGNISQLRAFGAMPPRRVEENLGYNSGRLARGYWICLLIGNLAATDFELDGTTLRSGGKIGAPGETQREDNARTRVHDQIIQQNSSSGYAELQKAGLASVPARGDGRLAKVVPVIPHMRHASPAQQYPMGGGFLQWRIKAPGKSFFVAAFIDAQGLAQTPAFTARTDTAAPYDERARLRRYLETAP
jgi:hypothetical protein